MTLRTSCEEHAPKDVSSYLKKLFSNKKIWSSQKLKEYKTRC